jgi:hypothetical protein
MQIVQLANSCDQGSDSFVYPTMQGISWVAKELSACHEGYRPMQLVNYFLSRLMIMLPCVCLPCNVCVSWSTDLILMQEVYSILNIRTDRSTNCPLYIQITLIPNKTFRQIPPWDAFCLEGIMAELQYWFLISKPFRDNSLRYLLQVLLCPVR